MKAWWCFSLPDYDEQIVVFAETRGKAKVIAQSTEKFDYFDFTHIGANRMKEADVLYKGQQIADWNDKEVRLFLVKNCGWSCLDRDEKMCEICNAKKYCAYYDNKIL